MHDLQALCCRLAKASDQEERIITVTSTVVAVVILHLLVGAALLSKDAFRKATLALLVM